MKLRSVLWATVLLLPAWLGLHAQAGDAGASAHDEHLTVTLVVPPQSLEAGKDVTAGLHFTMAKGWHIYWSNAGDSGEPPEAKWTLPAGITAQPIEFPAPQRLPLGPLMDFGYENEVTFPIPIHVANTAKPGPATLTAKLEWLVCREVCLPGNATLTVTRPVVAAGQAVQLDSAAQKIVDAGIASLPKPLPPGDRAVFAVQGTKGYTLAVLTGAPVEEAKFFPSDQTVVSNPAPEQATPLAHGVKLSLVRDENQSGKLTALNGVVELPDGRNYLVAAQPGAIPTETAAAAAKGNTGLGEAILLGFLGGIILNLMPCVFPVLFIKALALVNASQEERRIMRTHGLVYTFGILVSFWAVAGVLIALRGAGHSLGWGFQFQSPVFLALISMLLFFVSLSLAGQFEIGLSLTSKGGSLAAKSGYTGAFFTGVLAVVVATPCAAPLMGVAIGYALAHSALLSLVVFSALGLGLAAPALLLAYNPAWTRWLPKPGAWMETMKQIVSIPIFATVIWLVWLFAGIAGVNALMGLLLAFLLLGIAGGVLGKRPGNRAAAVWATALLLIGVAVPLYAIHTFGEDTTSHAAATASADNIWKPFTPEALAAARAAGKPVLVDFTAKWCLSCQVNERVVLDRADVQERLRQSGLVLLKADWTQHDQSITDTLAALGRSTIPTYALYPAGDTGAPKLLPEVLTTGAVFSAIHSLKSGDNAAAGQ